MILNYFMHFAHIMSKFYRNVTLRGIKNAVAKTVSCDSNY